MVAKSSGCLENLGGAGGTRMDIAFVTDCGVGCVQLVLMVSDEVVV